MLIRYRVGTIVVLTLMLAAWANTLPVNSLGDDPSTFDQQLDTAYLKRDVAFIDAVTSDDMRFTHATGMVWDKQAWLNATRTYTAHARDVDSVQVERHGDVIETTGHLLIKSANPQTPENHTFFVRLYAKRDGRWLFLSHRPMRQVLGPLPGK